MEYKVAYYDPAVDPADPACDGQKIYIFWHEYILAPLYMRGNCNLAMLLEPASRRRDSGPHRLSHGLRLRARLDVSAAARSRCANCSAIASSCNLAITPDGPRGPRRTLAPGCVFLASKLGLPLVLMGMGYDRPWRAGSWDRFAVPRPGSRVRAVIEPGDHDSAESRPRWHRALSRQSRAAVEPADGGGGSVGGIGHTQRA